VQPWAPPERAVIAVTPLLHEIIPHGWTRMGFIICHISEKISAPPARFVGHCELFYQSFLNAAIQRAN
jgi:hypothetical protein